MLLMAKPVEVTSAYFKYPWVAGDTEDYINILDLTSKRDDLDRALDLLEIEIANETTALVNQLHAITCIINK
jgi:hypothetical protein